MCTCDAPLLCIAVVGEAIQFMYTTSCAGGTVPQQGQRIALSIAECQVFFGAHAHWTLQARNKNKLDAMLTCHISFICVNTFFHLYLYGFCRYSFASPVQIAEGALGMLDVGMPVVSPFWVRTARLVATRFVCAALLREMCRLLHTHTCHPSLLYCATYDAQLVLCVFVCNSSRCRQVHDVQQSISAMLPAWVVGRFVWNELQPAMTRRSSA